MQAHRRVLGRGDSWAIGAPCVLALGVPIAPARRASFRFHLLNAGGMLSSRDDVIQRLSEEQFDVVVVGGGICGAGVALDAASRGLRVALVERRDLASGTSSKSSRQIHGGLRYLAHGEVGLVRESLAERRVLSANAPHLVSPLPMRLPLARHPLQLRAGLTVYDALGAWRYGGRHRPRKGALTYHEGSVEDAGVTLA